MLVAKLDGDPVLAGCRRQVRNGYRTIFVVVTADVRLAGTFHGQRQTAYSENKNKNKQHDKYFYENFSKKKKKTRVPAPAPFVKIVKLDGSPLTPWVRPGPYAVMCPLEMESTWNLNGEPSNNHSKSVYN